MLDPTGLQAGLSFPVTDADTALALGSGDVAVLATPRALAWAEAATCAAVAPVLDPVETTVGTHVDVRHLRPSLVGDTVTVTAEVVAVDRRVIAFDVLVRNPDGTTALTGSVSRVCVERAGFGVR